MEFGRAKISIVSLLLVSGSAMAVEKMIPLSQLLQERAARDEMVPESAAKDEDFIRFMTALSSRIPGTNQLRPIAQTFRIEAQSSGVDVYEMYLRLKNILAGLKHDLETLAGIVRAEQTGRGYARGAACVNAHVCIGWGLRLGFGLGWERRNRWVFPLLSLKLQSTKYRGGALGAFADFGLQSSRAGGRPTYGETQSGDIEEKAFIVGTVETDGSETFKGIVLGIGSAESSYHGWNLHLPLLPIPTGSQSGRALKILASLAREIQHFNLTKAALLSQNLRNIVASMDDSYRARTGASAPQVNLETSHPFASPGMMFSGSALVYFSPDLVPDLVAIYNPGRFRKRAQIVCQQNLIDLPSVQLPEKTATALPQ
jgi:hypothetical protein